MKFSDSLKEFRKQNNLTQQELADKLFVSRSAIAKWEQDRGLPSEELLQQISTLMDVPLDQLIDNQQLRNTVIKNQRKLSKQKRIILLLLCVGFAALSVAVGLFIRNLKIAPPPTEPIEAVDSFYAIARVEDNVLYFDYDDTSLVDSRNTKLTKLFISTLSLDLEEKANLLCVNRYYVVCRVDTVKSYNHIKVFYKYIVSDGDWRDSVEISHIQIIDDYSGEPPAFKGLFFSITPYDKDYAPVPTIYGNYSEEAKSEALPSNVALYQKYPYILSQTEKPIPHNKTVYGHCFTSIVEKQTKFHPIYHYVTEQSISYEFSVLADTIYVYFLDDSEKGYYEYGTMNRDLTNYILEIETFLFTKENVANSIYKMNWTIKIRIGFRSEDVKATIYEYDATQTCIKTTTIYNQAELLNLNYIFMFSDQTRYANVYVTPVSSNWKNSYQKLIPGDSITVAIPNQYGIITPKKLHFY